MSTSTKIPILESGDVILTGTPAGSGDFQTPRLALRPGDRLESEVEGIGRLSNPVVAPDWTNQVVGAT
ncbi:fumarylacetoacetate hydrolase family protein [Saccharopolyspora pogona]|uniref:fumarylacetoacetate hydrolase family protein n=1 Tax=Saccharopolyspora pogona TaxID=333966 RepID=UPI001CC230DC|nr:fumarylacetoacetate hydrolase family protein [Saccharopolyspora pogona]